MCQDFLKFILSNKEIDPTISVALTAHYTPNLMQYYCNLCLSRRLSTKQYLLLLLFMLLFKSHFCKASH
jgi:hypothetical protein